MLEFSSKSIITLDTTYHSNTIYAPTSVWNPYGIDHIISRLKIYRVRILYTPHNNLDIVGLSYMKFECICFDTQIEVNYLFYPYNMHIETDTHNRQTDKQTDTKRHTLGFLDQLHHFLNCWLPLVHASSCDWPSGKSLCDPFHWTTSPDYPSLFSH